MPAQHQMREPAAQGRRNPPGIVPDDMQAHIAIAGVPIMPVAVPVFGGKMKLHIAAVTHPGDGQLRLQKIRPVGTVLPAGIDHRYLLKINRLQGTF